jgi:hypothetical protein
MVIERFRDSAEPEIYRRFRDKGRMMPEGLEYVSSWIDLDFKICWQLMQTEDFALFDQWIANWRRDGFRDCPGAHVDRGGSDDKCQTVGTPLASRWKRTASPLVHLVHPGIDLSE